MTVILQPQKKKKRSVIRIFFYILAAIYCIVFVMWLLNRNISLDVFREGEISTVFRAKAVIIHESYVFRSHETGSVEYLYSDGQRVKKSAEIMYIYPEDAKELKADYTSLEEEILELKRGSLSDESALNNEVIKLRTDRDELMFDLYMPYTDLKNSFVTSKLVDSLNKKIIDRRYEESSKNYDVTSLEADLSNVRNELEDSNYVIRSPESGIFTSKTDGYEITSFRDYAASLTTSVINAAIHDPAGPRYDVSDLGKIITSDYYYYILIIPKDIHDMISDRYYIRVEIPGIEGSFYAVSHQSILQEDGEYILILKTNRYLETLINKRVVDIKIDIASEKGIIIPREAVFYPDEDNSVPYIYISRNGYILKVGVSIKASDEENYIIEADGLRTYDLLVENPEKAREGMFIQ